MDTHKDLHIAAVIDTSGQVLDTGSFSTTRAGYRALLKWLRSHGDVRLVVVEAPAAMAKAIKVEYVHRHHFRTRTEARLKIANWITDFYNRRRCHSVCDGRSPIDYERSETRALEAQDA
ncbi:IS3 family transposase [Micromonospora fiedleri]|uniref:IS3 family transposase n=1 Tax=Micromonospora fiedleri TaxID=1157498 RepID=A0ABS1UW16_9ACTN|nr:IS3 family transposase [Micromonospora fiedleri]